jgi:tRNA A-37 threonylcarbamoyl transferase component Bud32
MPLVAVWMEEVIGSRLEKRGLDGIVAAEVLRGLGEIHERGVVQGDIKWRNILVEEGSGSVRWVDFSNAVVKGSVEGEDEGEWQVLVDKETRECRKMLRLPVEDSHPHPPIEEPEEC